MEKVSKDATEAQEKYKKGLDQVEKKIIRKGNWMSKK